MPGAPAVSSPTNGDDMNILEKMLDNGDYTHTEGNVKMQLSGHGGYFTETECVSKGLTLRIWILTEESPEEQVRQIKEALGKL